MIHDPPPHDINWSRAGRAAAIGLLLLPLVLMAKPLLRGGVPFFMDPLMYFLPLRAHAAALLHDGQLPLWNRCLMGGMPLFENPQAALAYPLNWPFLAWPSGFWFLFPQLFQLGLYTALTAWALRRIGARRGAALFGGALALAGAYGWSRLQYGNFMNVLPWWPLWLGAAHAYVVSRRARWLAAGALAAALMILAGAHQLAFYGFSVLGLYGLVQAALDRTSRGVWLSFLLITYTLGLLIGAPGWLPQVGFIAETSRPAGMAAEAVLAGAIGSVGELARALAGDWGLLLPGRDGWADAESAAALGPIALIFALFFIPPRGPLRRAWLACWLAAALAILLSLRPVMTLLLEWIPATGIFHGPRRWLGVAQWMILLAAALGACSLMNLGWRKVSVAAMALAVTSLGLYTWRTVELTTIPAGPILRPTQPPLLARAGLEPGQRFFTIDYKRDFSYDFRRPDLLDWMLPNLGMIYGFEDLGGYEPAQSAAWRKYMDELHATEPGRRLWPHHFALIQAPHRQQLLDEGSVHAAIMPRWGVPQYFSPAGPGVWIAPAPTHADRLLSISTAAASTGIRLEAIRGDRIIEVAQADAVQLGPMADLLAPPERWPGIPRLPSPGAGRLLAAQIQPPPTTADLWAIRLPDGAQLADGYIWGERHSALWEPVAVREIAALMRYRGAPAWATFRHGEGRVLSRLIHANRIEIEVEITSAPAGTAELILREAYWPGWRVRVDGQFASIHREGPWRVIRLDRGRQRIWMDYTPRWLDRSIIFSFFGCILLIKISLMLRNRRRTRAAH